MIQVVNGLDKGRPFEGQTVSRSLWDVDPDVMRSQQLAVRGLLSDAAIFARERRQCHPGGDAVTGAPLTGLSPVSATLSLVKHAEEERGYARITKRVTQVPLVAANIDEPDSNYVVDTLEALPADEAQFYSSEDNVVDFTFKSKVILAELEQQYGFVGGSQSEYVSYFHRDNLPTNMWHWDLWSECRTVTGFSTVCKKKAPMLRKLLMAVASNYCFVDPKVRADLGMAGGGALTRVHSEGKGLAIASCDESNAFTYVLMPKWMWKWFACPPLPAIMVWKSLPLSLQLLCNPATWVSPQYMRLPMGCSHSVHILMMINIRYIGLTLLESRKLLVNKDCRNLNAKIKIAAANDRLEETEMDSFFGISDEDWWNRQELRRDHDKFEAGWSVDEFCKSARAAKHASIRIMVILICFAGERRPQDIHDWLSHMCCAAAIQALIISVDLATDARWDLSLPATFHKLLSLAEQGFIDILIGGPPCATVSAARFNTSSPGPRPVRFRDEFWGRKGLSQHEHSRVVEANTLYINFLALLEAVGSRGGGFLLEQPEDRGRAPYPSLLATAELLGVTLRVGGVIVNLHQCPFGAPVPKGTGLFSNFADIVSLDEVRCPGVSSSHAHTGKSSGINAAGHFNTRRLQTYPPLFAREIALRAMNTIKLLIASGTGPTGFLHPHQPVIRSTNFGARHSGTDQLSISILNEDVVHGRHVWIDELQNALYLHVDDGVFLSLAHGAKLHADDLMQLTADGLETAGFKVPDRQCNAELDKVIGYQLDRASARFSLPSTKKVLLRAACIEQANCSRVDTEVIRSLVGIWLFAALLRRDLLCIPHSIFRFIDANQGRVVRWWPEAKREMLAMAHTVPLCYYDAAHCFARTMLATDAMGASTHDHGGYGLVAATVTDTVLRECLEVGEQPGFTVARLNGDLSGLKHPERAIKATKPFTRLPDCLFDGTVAWTSLTKGRWGFTDHITLGEARAVTKAIQILAAFPSSRNHIILSLQDNRPCAGANNKGRSTAFALNRVLRRKTAMTIAACFRVMLPWVETKKQPADFDSRDIDFSS